MNDKPLFKFTKAGKTFSQAHPTEINITARVRNSWLLINILLVIIAAWPDNYVTFSAGLYTRFVHYFFMHLFYNQPWAQKVFPCLQASLIHYHCHIFIISANTRTVVLAPALPGGICYLIPVFQPIQGFPHGSFSSILEIRAIRSPVSSTFAALLKKQRHEYTTSF